MIIKKYLFIAITVFSSLLSVNSNADEIIGYWVDANGMYLGDKVYITDNDVEAYLTESTTRFVRDGWRSYYNITDKSFELTAQPIEKSINNGIKYFYYGSNDCSGNGAMFDLFGIPGENLASMAPSSSILWSTPDLLNKKVLQITADTYGNLMLPGAMSSMSPAEGSLFDSKAHFNDDGMLVCEPAYNITIADVGWISHTENIVGKYRWMKFKFSDDDQNTVVATIKGAVPPFKFISTQDESYDPDAKPRIEYQSPVNSVSIRVSSQGKLSYVTVNQGQSLYIGDIKVSKLSTGVYDVTFPESYIAADRARDKLILTCNVNSNNRNQGGEMGISCYKLDAQNIIRIVTEYHKHPTNTDFTLGVKW